jgi:tRNA(Arg) A34 adenosine deaminase TadA
MIAPSLRRTAQRSTHPLFFHAAQVKLGGAVLATEHNSSRWGTKAEGHAETRACRRAAAKGRSLRGATVVSIRVTRNGKLANARPCAQCVENMRAYGVRKVLFSTATGDLHEMRL